MTALRVALVCLMLVSVVGISIGAANTSYSISPQQTIDIDSRTVEFESENYTVSEVGYASVNGELSVTTAGPDEGTYDLYLYNSERNIVTTESRLSGTATTTFDLDSLGVEAGTYILVINADGERKEVMPVVANGYDITIDAPDSATVGEDVPVSLSVSKKAGVDESIQSVKLHVRVDGQSRQVTATKTGDGTYEATVDIEQEGTFSVYAGVQGPDTVNGEYEVIAVSDAQTIEAAEQTATKTASGGGDQSDTTDSSDTEQSPSSTETTTSESTATSTTSTMTETVTETKTSTDTATGTADTTDTETVSETKTAESVVTPASSETTSATTETTADTGLAVSLVMLLALLVGWAGARRE